MTVGERIDALIAEATSLAAEFECRTPANGAPGIAHCAACCGGTRIDASCQEEFDFAVALDSLVRAGRAYHVVPCSVCGKPDHSASWKHDASAKVIPLDPAEERSWDWRA